MDFAFSPDTLMLRDMLRRFVQKEARPLEMKYFNSGKLEPEERLRLRKAVEQLGIWGLMVPEEFGGGGLDLVTNCMIEEEIGGTFVPVELGNISPLLYACTGEQVSQFLEPALEASRQAIIAAREPGSQGVKPEAWITTAEPNGDGYILTGKKRIASAPTAEDFYIVFARAPEGMTAFLLEPDTAGLIASTNGDRILSLDQVTASQASILGMPGTALSLGSNEAPRAWIQTGARYVGIGERLLEMSAEHARTWVSLGAPLAVRPAIQRMVAEMRVDIESSRWLVYHAAWLVDEGKNDLVRGTAMQVRLGTGEMLKRSIDRATILFNGPGTSAEIEPNLLVKSVVPFDALELALSHARVAIADEILSLPEA